MPFTAPEVSKCPKCGKSVYAAEEKVAGGKKWHVTCFKCYLCNKRLDSTNCAEHDNELYCKNCHARKYGPKGYGFGGGAGCLSMDTGEHLGNTESVSNSYSYNIGKIIMANDGTGCPRCGGAVYAAEQMLARGKEWHKFCFKCNNCSRQLDSMNHCDAPDGEIYCKACYAKIFGPKGYGFGKGAGTLQSEMIDGEITVDRPTVCLEKTIKAPAGEGCPRCGCMVYAAEEKLSKGKSWHKNCFSCFQCRKMLDSINACDSPEGEVYCKTCYGKKYGPKGYGYGSGAAFLQTDSFPDEQVDEPLPSWLLVDTTSIQAPRGEGCPRCGGKVFAAEQKLARGTVWHRKCFSCYDCRRPLDSVVACDGPDKEIYCRRCYGRRFGPKGFGFGQCPTCPSSSIPVGRRAPPGEGCPRCGLTVYAAEAMLARGMNWHRSCFTCADCHKSLDSTTVCDAPDGEIYCKGDYAKKFGPRGFGYGLGAGCLTNA